MNDRELDLLLGELRREAPGMEPVAPLVLERVVAGRRPWLSGWSWWWAAVPAPVAASVLLWVMLVPARHRLAPVPEPSRASRSAPVAPQPAPTLVAKWPERKPTGRPRPRKRSPGTEFIERNGQSEVVMETRDPNIKIIWIAKESEGGEL